MDIPEASKEYIWCTKLDKKTKSNQWEGRDDGGLEQLVLKRACLGAGAKDGERNLIEVTSFDHKQEKVEACICSLRAGAQEDVSLSDLTIFPPAIFKLVEGSGPIHLVGNHMIMEDDEGSDADFDEDDVSDELSEEEDLSEEEVEKVEKPVAKVKPEKQKQQAKKGLIEDEAEDEDEEDEDDLSGDEEMEEEEEEEKPLPKKRKLEQKNKKPEPAKKGKTEATPQKKKKSDAPKTPLQQKENKAPQSGKKTPAKVYESVDEVKSAIKKYQGGKPKKEEKFCNWVKSTFKVTEEKWLKDLWKAHKMDLGL